MSKDYTGGVRLPNMTTRRNMLLTSAATLFTSALATPARAAKESLASVDLLSTIPAWVREKAGTRLTVSINLEQLETGERFVCAFLNSKRGMELRNSACKVDVDTYCADPDKVWRAVFDRQGKLQVNHERIQQKLKEMGQFQTP
jgi:hypothetical protein